MRLPNTKILIIIAGVILIVLIAITIFVSGLTSRGSTSQQQPTLIPTGIFESTGEFGQKQNLITPTLTKEQLLNEIPEMTSGALNYLTGDQLVAFNALKNKLPYSSSNLDIKFSPEVNQFIVSKKTLNADSELNKLLEENNFLGSYQTNPGLFVVGSEPINKLIENRQNDLLLTLTEGNFKPENDTQQQTQPQSIEESKQQQQTQPQQQSSKTSSLNTQTNQQSHTEKQQQALFFDFVKSLITFNLDTNPNDDTGGVSSGVGGGSGGNLPPPQPYSGGGTPQLKQIMSVVMAIPGISWGGICVTSGHGTNFDSEHYHCNAVDIFGSKALLISTAAKLVAAAKNNGLPIHCVIYDHYHYSIEYNYAKRPYTPPYGNDYHETHIHVSGWPSITGNC